MGVFKNLVIDILELHERGRTVAEIAQTLQVGRSVVEYAIDIYATDHDIDATWGALTV